MTAYRPPMLMCDYQDCVEEYGPGCNTVDDLRATAKTAAGWSLLAGRDLCPTHTAALVGKKPKIVANGPTELPLGDDVEHTAHGDD